MKLYFDNAAAVPVRPVTMTRLAALMQDHSANQEASGAAAEAVRGALATAERRLLVQLCGSYADRMSVLWVNTGTEAVRAAVTAFLLTPERHGTVLFTDGEHASVPAA
ncbi:MAG: aminotransferase class V-fold PLP-dependent enzyme, partial [Lentisphaeria bacterium]|nr:aminotransferase class V-fold PLP-dependent enzyme [Lentisphaeria bacterium]